VTGWLLAGSAFLAGIFGFAMLVAAGLSAGQGLERPGKTPRPTRSKVSDDGDGVTSSMRLAARAKELLLTDADEIVEGTRRRQRRFHRHPLRMHLLYVGAYLFGYAAFWYVAGAKPALVILGVSTVLFAANVLAVVARRLR